LVTVAFSITASEVCLIDVYFFFVNININVASTCWPKNVVVFWLLLWLQVAEDATMCTDSVVKYASLEQMLVLIEFEWSKIYNSINSV